MAEERFRDTLVVSTSDAPAPHELYDTAQRLFAAGQYERARVLFARLRRSPQVPDSLAMEALFAEGECAAAIGQLAAARTAYERLLSQPALPSSLRERALLRLGHVLCALGDERTAARVFAQFRQEFPTSRYLPLANCASVGSPLPGSPQAP